MDKSTHLSKLSVLRLGRDAKELSYNSVIKFSLRSSSRSFVMEENDSDGTNFRELDERSNSTKLANLKKADLSTDSKPTAHFPIGFIWRISQRGREVQQFICCRNFRLVVVTISIWLLPSILRRFPRGRHFC